MSLDPNSVIFDSMDLPSSLLSKNINCPNFSPSSIIRLDKISKDISKFPYFSKDSTLIHQCYSIRDYFIKLVILGLVLTKIGVYSTITQICSINGHRMIGSPLESSSLRQKKKK